MSEGFHLLEEALRSECEVQCVVAASSVISNVESHIRGSSTLAGGIGG